MEHSAQDAAAIVRDYTKWDDNPVSLPHFAESAVRAYRISMALPREPVVLVADSELQERPVPKDANLRIPKLTLDAPPSGDAGAVAEVARLLVINTIAPASRYFFDRVYTQGPDPSQRNSNSGHGVASLLLGIPVSGNLGFGPSLTIYGRYYGFYFQDGVQLTNKLTANFGFRYEHTTPWAEKWVA